MAKAVVGPDGTVIRKIPPKKVGRPKLSESSIKYVDQALLGTAKTGTTAWKFIDFPLDKVHIRSKTGSAEVHGKQSTSWVASYDKNYVVMMMVTQAGTGSGTSGPAVRKIWEALYGVKGMDVNKKKAALPDAKPPVALPVFAKDGEILPPMARTSPGSGKPKKKASHERRRRPAPHHACGDHHHAGLRGQPRLGADVRRGGPARRRRAARVVGHLDPQRPHRRATRTPTSSSSWSTSPSASCSA